MWPSMHDRPALGVMRRKIQLWEQRKCFEEGNNYSNIWNISSPNEKDSNTDFKQVTQTKVRKVKDTTLLPPYHTQETHTMAGKSGNGAASNSILSPACTCSLWSDVKAKAKGVIKRWSWAETTYVNL